MKRRRQRLEVSTFPFLAVLLCAMGSLILLLLVLDRRAKIVARAKAAHALMATQEELAARAEEARAALRAREQAREEELTRRTADRNSRIQALHNQLEKERTQVADRLHAAENRRSLTAAEIKAAEERRRQLEQMIRDEEDDLAQAAQEVDRDRSAEQKAQALGESAKKEAERLSGELRTLESALAAYKNARKRESQTYSLIPYRGKRGEARRPLYIECTARGLIFHPDRKAILTVRDLDVLKEVQGRIERQREALKAAGAPPDKPYLLMLIRPDGIGSYYEALNALHDLDLDFGYEFVDADWVLDFPEADGEPGKQPWMTAEHTPLATGGNGPTRKVTGQHNERSWVPGGDGDGPGVARGPGASGGATAGLPPLPGEIRQGPPGATGTGSGGSGRGGVPWVAASPGTGGLPPLPSTGSGMNGSVAGITGNGGGAGGNGGSGQGGVPWVAASPNTGGLPSLPSASARMSGSVAAIPGMPGGMAANGGGTGVPGSGSGVGLGPPNVAGEPGTQAGTGVGSASADGQGGTPGGGGGSGQPGGSGTGTGNGGSGIPGSGGGSPGGSGGGGGPPGSGSNSGQPGSANSQENPGTPGSTGGAPGTPAGSPSKGGTKPVLPPLPGDQYRSQGQGNGTGQAGSGEPSAGMGGSGQAGVGGSPSSGGTAGDPGGEDSPQSGRGTFLPTPVEKQPPPPRTMRLVGNRDWIIVMECYPDSVVLRAAGQQFSVATLAGKDCNLLPVVKQLIARRQASVRPGDPPYRPQIRFLVRPDSLRIYHLAYPLLEPLGIPLTRQNVSADSEDR